MLKEKLEEVSHLQKRRITYIDFRTYFLGSVSRQDLVSRFGMKEASATRDLARYQKLAPDNLEYDSKAKKYFSTDLFQPVFEHNPHQVLMALSQGGSDDSFVTQGALISCEVSALLSHPSVEILAAITKAIFLKRPVEIDYYSTGSGSSTRAIVPFSLVDNGLRWHVRAYDRKREKFLDIVITRVSRATIIDEEIQEHETSEFDNQWNHIVDLEIVPHPNRKNLPHPETISLDYKMTDNVLKIQTRAAIAGYLLRRFNVDCSKDHNRKGSEYQLWLQNSPILYGVENLFLAPGYASSD